MVVRTLSMGGLPNDYENFVTLKNQCRITVLLLFFCLKSQTHGGLSFVLC